MTTWRVGAVTPMIRSRSLNTHRNSSSTVLHGDVPVPKYYRVKEALLQRIADGSLAPGAPVPSEPELGKEFGVSRITIRKAIGDLVHQGKLRTVQGKGTFVVRPKLQERFVQRAFGIYRI